MLLKKKLLSFRFLMSLYLSCATIVCIFDFMSIFTLNKRKLSFNEFCYNIKTNQILKSREYLKLLWASVSACERPLSPLTSHIHYMHIWTKQKAFKFIEVKVHLAYVCVCQSFLEDMHEIESLHISCIFALVVQGF